MKLYLSIGRIFFGMAIMGIGILHFFYPGIRPVLIPGLTDLSANLSFLAYLMGFLLIGSGLLVTLDKKYNTIALFMGILFLGCFLFGHLPFSLTSGAFNEYWVNTNKILALAGGFLALSTVNAPEPKNKLVRLLSKIGPLGKYLYAIMLYNFAVGHYNNLEGISNLVPNYIPFPSFWTFLGGMVLMGSAISIFSGYRTKGIMLLLSLNLFVWLVTLHLYYNVLYPNWQNGENFIGSLTCLAFCGTALVISQSASKAKSDVLE